MSRSNGVGGQGRQRRVLLRWWHRRLVLGRPMGWDWPNGTTAGHLPRMLRARTLREEGEAGTRESPGDSSARYARIGDAGLRKPAKLSQVLNGDAPHVVPKVLAPLA